MATIRRRHQTPRTASDLSDHISTKVLDQSIQRGFDGWQRADVLEQLVTRGDRVAIALDLPDTPETKVLLAWAAAMETALHTLASRTRTAAAADPTERASSACLKCIHRCEKIVVPEDDRLAGVICMLNCPCD